MTKGLGQTNAKHLLIPAFFDGGRFTINDVHYVQEGNELVPVGDTQFSKDSSFGYRSSNLQDYILEKYDQKLERATVGSIALNELRENGLHYLDKVLDSKKSHLVVNAMRQSDLELLALSCLRHRDPLVFRTAASFVNAIAGIKKKPILGRDEVLASNSPLGALLVVGSYVTKTTEQLTFLKSHWPANYIEYDVLNGNTSKLIEEIDLKISEGENVVLYTSRKLVKGADRNDSLRIINKVSRDLVHIVKSLRARPKYILAKGGITSSDIATQALAVSRALVLGQVHKGVPVWRLSKGSKFPELSYVVFPGNVGDESALWNVVNRLS